MSTTDYSQDTNFSRMVIRLLKGPVLQDDPVWNDVLMYPREINSYFRVMGLELHIHESDGFAYVGQIDSGDEEEALPRLIRRIPLSFEVSLLLVILREELEMFDFNSDSTRLFLTSSQIKERITIYFKEKTDQTRLIREFDKYIRKVKDLGFIREAKKKGEGFAQDVVYEVMRIVKARVTPEYLEEFKEKMKTYVDAI